MVVIMQADGGHTKRCHKVDLRFTWRRAVNKCHPNYPILGTYPCGGNVSFKSTWSSSHAMEVSTFVGKSPSVVSM